MKKLSCTEWGADENVLEKLYLGRIRPVLEYGMATSSTAAKSKSVQNVALGHENDDWRHAEHTYICCGDCHRSVAFRRQTRNRSTDTGCKVQKTPGSPDA